MVACIATFSLGYVATSHAATYQRQECVEDYRFYKTLHAFYKSQSFTIDIYESKSACNAYRGIGPYNTCVDVKKEGDDFYYYNERLGWLLLK